MVKKTLRNRESAPVVRANQQFGYLQDTDLVEQMIKVIEGQNNSNYNVHGKNGAY